MEDTIPSPHTGHNSLFASTTDEFLNTGANVMRVTAWS
jgi:hypothetical protein